MTPPRFTAPFVLDPTIPIEDGTVLPSLHLFRTFGPASNPRVVAERKAGAGYSK
jgi:hypothetical protein